MNIVNKCYSLFIQVDNNAIE